MIELRVNEILKEKGMTMTELAAKIGVNRVNLYHSLESNPTLSRLKQVAKALGVDMQDLFKKKNEGVSICGFVEVDGYIAKIGSLAELKELVLSIEEGIEIDKAEGFFETED